MTHHCAVIGNPIAHSRSPEIHAGFAAARGIDLQYDRILARDEAEFAATVARFFADGGRGLNVTVPYKQTAYRLCERTTPYAAAAEAANTLWQENGKLCGDNTDGRGLCLALQEHGIALAGVRILMSHGINRREMVIAATSIGLGLGVSFKPEVFGQLPLKELFQNPICMGGLAALLMNLVMPDDNASRVYLSDDLEV